MASSDRILFLAGRNAHNFNRVPDHVGGALLAFRSGGRFSYLHIDATRSQKDRSAR